MGAAVVPHAKQGFFLRAETAFQMIENLGGVPRHWEDNTAEVSHGEGFLTVFREMFNKPGFYIRDHHDGADGGPAQPGPEVSAADRGVVPGPQVRLLVGHDHAGSTFAAVPRATSAVTVVH
ncbi:hypothetical protein [Saccharopolyspora sp. NPDC049426]|uniref:hypothetical protein n=1 Tax=Saccharopolyspora sp. NPDC049426 TaxID=3155652 RepID=UPI00342DB601